MVFLVNIFYINLYKISLNIVFVVKLWSILAILWSILPILWSILSILWSILPYLWLILFCCLSNIAKALSPFIDLMCMCKTCSKTNKKGSFGNLTKVTCSYYIKDLHIFLKHRRYICQTWLLYRFNLHNSDFWPFSAKIPIFRSEFVFFRFWVKRRSRAF